MKGAIMLSGGGAKLFAAIGVTYPEGSAVTCTNGVKTLSAKNTSGQWVFAIPAAGTWTVTATDGTNSKSEAVEITAEGQCVSVELRYGLVLFDGENGGDNTAVTGGWSKSGDTLDVTSEYVHFTDTRSGETQAQQNYGVRTTQAIDLTEYTTLKAIVTYVKGGSSEEKKPVLGVATTASPYVYAGGKRLENGSETTEYSFDISNYSDNHYVGFFWSFKLYGTYSDYAVKFTKIWLE